LTAWLFLYTWQKICPKIVTINFSDMLKKKKNKDDMQDPKQEQTQTEETAQKEETAEVQTETENTSENIPEEEKLRAQTAELNDKYIRLYAEFDNYKRRTALERRELLQTASKDVLVNLLPVLDDFERALKAMETASD